MDFIFHEIPESMCRLILKHTLIAQNVFVGTTDCETGQSVYLKKKERMMMH